MKKITTLRWLLSSVTGVHSLCPFCSFGLLLWTTPVWIWQCEASRSSFVHPSIHPVQCVASQMAGTAWWTEWGREVSGYRVGTGTVTTGKILLKQMLLLRRLTQNVPFSSAMREQTYCDEHPCSWYRNT